MRKLSFFLKGVLIYCFFGGFSISKINAFWGITTKQQLKICREIAAEEKNDLNSKKSYEYCIKNIKREKKEELK